MYDASVFRQKSAEAEIVNDLFNFFDFVLDSITAFPEDIVLEI